MVGISVKWLRLVVLSLVLAGCGGGGSGGSGDSSNDGTGDGTGTGDSGTATAPVLSRSRVAPLESFSLMDSSLVVGDTGTVRMVGNDGFDITLSYVVLDDGRVDLVAPAPFDLPLDNGQRTLDLYLDGVAADAFLTVDALPQSDSPPGAILHAYLTARLDLADENYFALDDLVSARPTLNTTDTEAIFDHLEEQGFLIDDQLFLVESLMSGDVDTIELPIGGGASVSLTAADLPMLDSLLLALGNSLDQVSTDAAVSTATRASMTYRLSGEEAQAMFARVLRDAKVKGLAGTKVLLGVVGAGVAVFALAEGGAVLIVGSAAGIGLFYLGTSVDIGLSAALDKAIAALESAGDSAADTFQEARASLRTYADGVLAWCGAAPGPVGNLCTALGGASALESAVTATGDLRCDEDPAFCAATEAPNYCAPRRSRSPVTDTVLPLVQPRCLLPAGADWPDSGDGGTPGGDTGGGDTGGGGVTDTEVQPGFYGVRKSGSGWRRMWAGAAYYISGYQVFPIRLTDEVTEPSWNSLYWSFPLDHDLDAQFAQWRDNDIASSERACSSGPALCPCQLQPDIWVDGPVFDLLDTPYAALADYEQQLADPGLDNLESGSAYQWVYDYERRSVEVDQACGL